jgi:hypothetical protein
MSKCLPDNYYFFKKHIDYEGYSRTKIAICSDHAGFELKQVVNQYLLDKNPVAYHDFGTYTAESCDYADFAHPMASAVEHGGIRFWHFNLRKRKRNQYDCE